MLATAVSPTLHSKNDLNTVTVAGRCENRVSKYVTRTYGTWVGKGHSISLMQSIVGSMKEWSLIICLIGLFNWFLKEPCAYTFNEAGFLLLHKLHCDVFFKCNDMRSLPYRNLGHKTCRPHCNISHTSCENCLQEAIVLPRPARYTCFGVEFLCNIESSTIYFYIQLLLCNKRWQYQQCRPHVHGQHMYSEWHSLLAINHS